MASIELNDIVKSFGATIAINHVNLSVEDGEFLVLLGPSGCGKTTTLRSIAGLEQVDSGEIKIDNKKVNDLKPADRDMSFCFQQYALYPHLNAYENIAFPLRTQGTPREEIEARVSKVGETLKITDIFKRKPRNLSSGDQQRIALARAMVRHPKVFLMDEPLSNLDAKLREDMRIELRHIQFENKVTTIYVTHDQVEAMALADRIAIMNKGHLLQVGAPEDIYQFPATLFVANFIGSPSMNFIPSTFDKSSSSVVIDFGDVKYVQPLPKGMQSKASGLTNGASLLIGIRPENVTVATNGHKNGAMQLSLKLTENLGSENIHHLERGAIHLTARTDSDVLFKEGSPVHVSFEEDGVRLYDPQTEKAIA
jgi:multiple sugar transport system ATP-binding protein